MWTGGILKQTQDISHEGSSDMRIDFAVSVPNISNDFQATKLTGRGYSCNFCFKEIRDKKDMKRHLPVHTKEKLFPCTVCGVRFSRKDTLKFHIKSVHNLI